MTDTTAVTTDDDRDGEDPSGITAMVTARKPRQGFLRAMTTMTMVTMKCTPRLMDVCHATRR